MLSLLFNFHRAVALQVSIIGLPLTQPLPAVSHNIVYQNMAKGGTASQDSTSAGGVASRAIDGNKNPNYKWVAKLLQIWAKISSSKNVDQLLASSWLHLSPSGGASCTHSAATTNTFWKVKLTSEAAVDHVILWNRMDCCQERLDGAMVSLGQISDKGDRI